MPLISSMHSLRQTSLPFPSIFCTSGSVTKKTLCLCLLHLSLCTCPSPPNSCLSSYTCLNLEPIIAEHFWPEIQFYCFQQIMLEIIYKLMSSILHFISVSKLVGNSTNNIYYSFTLKIIAFFPWEAVRRPITIACQVRHQLPGSAPLA